jgi:hypothetical protein
MLNDARNRNTLAGGKADLVALPVRPVR